MLAAWHVHTQNSLYQHVEDMWERHSQEIKAGQFQVRAWPRGALRPACAMCEHVLPCVPTPRAGLDRRHAGQVPADAALVAQRVPEMTMGERACDELIPCISPRPDWQHDNWQPVRLPSRKTMMMARPA